jgi:hypothetical protein
VNHTVGGVILVAPQSIRPSWLLGMKAEFVYRGSTIEPTNHITLPASTKEGQTADAVDNRVNTIHGMNAREALEQARALWDAMPDASRS